MKEASAREVPDGNFIIYDWLSFTSKRHTPLQLADVLGLGHIPWETIKGARGYQDRLYFSCISIHFNGRPDMGVWVELSGQGCRTLETLSTLPYCWDDIFRFIYSCGLKITRLDVAYDDHIGLLDIAQIVGDTQCGEYVSKSTYWETVLSSKGSSVMIGSPQSDVRFRIYDKARERNCAPGTHWVRVEMQLRDDRAITFASLPQSIGEKFCGVTVNYLRYVDPDETDTNRWRWPMKEYWGELLLDASRIRIYRQPGMEYNFDQCERFVITQAGNAIDAYIQIVGMSEFKEKLSKRRTRPNPKYARLVKQWENFKFKF